MKRKLTILALMLATMFFWMPAAGDNVSAQNGNGKGNKAGNYGRSHKKNSYGYKNYGQYRRTQVGNRRYRLKRQYYTRDGNRLSRLVRIFY